MFENFGMVRGEFRIEERDIQILLGLEKWGVSEPRSVSTEQDERGTILP
jgi:hypothetical protein